MVPAFIFTKSCKSSSPSFFNYCFIVRQESAPTWNCHVSKILHGAGFHFTKSCRSSSLSFFQLLLECEAKKRANTKLPRRNYLQPCVAFSYLFINAFFMKVLITTKNMRHKIRVIQGHALFKRKQLKLTRTDISSQYSFPACFYNIKQALFRYNDSVYIDEKTHILIARFPKVLSTVFFNGVPHRHV